MSGEGLIAEPRAVHSSAGHARLQELMHRGTEFLGCDYYAKLENLQPTGAFKVRGGVNLVGTASDEERRQGLVSASTGNHGQSIAYAGRLFSSKVIIYAPAENVNESKMQAIRDILQAAFLPAKREA